MTTGKQEAARNRTRGILRKYAPEVEIGGFTRRDTTVLFYNLVNSVITSESVVLDLGAGRGAATDNISEYKKGLITLRGRVAKIIGVDVDEAVLLNKLLDESYVSKAGDKLPFDDQAFDLIISDWVLEHVEDPISFSSEIARLIKPGGWFLARTPNKYGLISILASIVPNSSHAPILKHLQPDRQSHDVFDTYYRINTLKSIDRFFPKEQWKNCSSKINAEMMYLTQIPIAYRIYELMTRIMPKSMYPVILVAIQKK